MGTNVPERDGAPAGNACAEVAAGIRAGRARPTGTGESATENVLGRVAPSLRQFAQVSLATLLVAGLPVAAVWWLRASGAVSSAAVGIGLGMALSLGVSRVACLVWQTRPGSEDLLFSELMIWGYLHRWRMQRRLASARELLGPISDMQPSAINGLDAKDPVSLLERLVARMETRDPYLHGHSRRVARHSWMIARRMGLSRAQVARIRTAAAIHDVGKVNTPKTILHKRGPLTAEEYDVIKSHPGDGARMVAVLHDSELTAIVRDHHERLDGSGYPNGLSGDEIPVGARIIAVADTFDAITSVRPYRLARTHKQAIEILREEAGRKLDPLAVRAFASHYAGRQPLVLWSTVAGLPVRLLSWLGEGLAGVASMAKVVAVAALIGGAAVTSSTLALPPAAAKSHHAPAIGSTRAVGSNAQPLQSKLVEPARSARAVTAGTPRATQAGQGGASRAPGPSQPLAPSAAAQPARSGRSNAGSAFFAGPRQGSSEEAPGRGRPEGAPHGGGSPEAHGKGQPEAAPPKGQAPQARAKGRSEEASAKRRPEAKGERPGGEEAKAMHTPEPAATAGKPENPAGGGTSQEGSGAGRQAPSTPAEAAESAGAHGTGH